MKVTLNQGVEYKIQINLLKAHSEIFYYVNLETSPLIISNLITHPTQYVKNKSKQAIKKNNLNAGFTQWENIIVSWNSSGLWYHLNAQPVFVEAAASGQTSLTGRQLTRWLTLLSNGLWGILDWLILLKLQPSFESNSRHLLQATVTTHSNDLKSIKATRQNFELSSGNLSQISQMWKYIFLCFYLSLFPSNILYRKKTNIILSYFKNVDLSRLIMINL